MANTPNRLIRLTDDQRDALESLAASLNISGQRGATLNPIIAHIADIAIAAPAELAWLLEIAYQVAIGGDLAELIELTPLPAAKE